MKKIITLTFVFLLCFASSVFAADEPMKLTKDGITVDVTSAKLEEVKGDRTKDNYADKNGEYLADGSKIVKAADYRNLVLNIKYTNSRNKAIHFADPPAMAWTLTLPDGKKMKQMQNYKFGEKLRGKVEKNSVVEDSITVLIKNQSKKDGFMLTYSLLDYTAEFNKAISGVLSGKITKKEWKEKYKKKFTPIDMSIKLKVE